MTGNNGWRGEPRPAFPFYAADWLSNERVQAMTLAQRGAYIDLLAIQWREGSVSDRVRIRLGSAGLPPGDVECVLEAFPASPVDGLRRNARLERERERLVQHKEKATLASKKANSVRWGSETDPKRIRNDPSSSSSSSTQTDKKAAPPARGSSKSRLDPEAELTGKPPWVVEAATAWSAYRAERRLKPYAPLGLRAFLGQLEAMGQVRAKAALDHSMASNYQGLYEPGAANGQPRGPVPSGSKANAAAYSTYHTISDERRKELTGNG